MVTPTTPDSRINLQPPPIDFVNIVGLTGQTHDSYPSDAQQPRADWMRSYLIGLLCNQASYREPTQFREGTFWYDLNSSTLKIRQNGFWVPFASALLVDVDSHGNAITLAMAYATIKTLLGFRPTASFGGSCTTQGGVTVIPIPQTLQIAAGVDSHPFLWINGDLINPRQLTFLGNPPSSIKLNGAQLNPGDVFTVLLLSVGANFMSLPDVIV